MAKKGFGKFVAFAAISGAVAAGVSYVLQYKIYHKELDKDFREFDSANNRCYNLHCERKKQRKVKAAGRKIRMTIKEESSYEVSSIIFLPAAFTFRCFFRSQCKL